MKNLMLLPWQCFTIRWFAHTIPVMQVTQYSQPRLTRFSPILHEPQRYPPVLARKLCNYVGLNSSVLAHCSDIRNLLSRSERLSDTDTHADLTARVMVKHKLVHSVTCWIIVPHAQESVSLCISQTTNNAILMLGLPMIMLPTTNCQTFQCHNILKLHTI